MKSCFESKVVCVGLLAVHSSHSLVTLDQKDFRIINTHYTHY